MLNVEGSSLKPTAKRVPSVSTHGFCCIAAVGRSNRAPRCVGPPLVGVTFHHQMVPIEVDALGAWTEITATNALQLVAGIF